MLCRILKSNRVSATNTGLLENFMQNSSWMFKYSLWLSYPQKTTVRRSLRSVGQWFLII